MNHSAAIEADVEPVGMTLADLVALVIGAALALSLAWYSSWASLRPLGTSAAPWWYSALQYTTEGLRKGCQALGPVILLRRMRHGGLLRPTEFAALFVGYPYLLQSIANLPVIGMLIPDPDRPSSPTLNMDVFQLWQRSELSLATLAGLALWLGRRRLSPWILGLLLVAVLRGVNGPVFISYQDSFNHIVVARRWPTAVNHVVSFACKQIPFGLLFYVPLVGAMRSLGRPGKTWLDRTAAVLVGAGWLIGQGLYLTYEWSSGWYRRERFVLDAMLPVLEIAISLIIVRRLGPTWGPRLGIGDGPVSRPTLESGVGAAMMAESSAGD